MSITLKALAERFSLEVRGDEQIVINGLGSITDSAPGKLTFLADASYRKHLASCQASAVLLGHKDVDFWQGAALVSKNPPADAARIAALFDPIQRPPPGIHPSAIVDETAQLGEAVHVGPAAVIEAGAKIGDRAIIGPHCMVGRDVSVGADTWLTANVTLYDRVSIGERGHFQPGAVIGGRGFGLAQDKGVWIEVPQLGSVRIGDDVEIGANTCVDRGALGDTVIEDNVKIDNLVQVGHNTHIGAHTAIAGCVGIAGSCKIGKRCQLGGAVGLAGHLHIVDDVIVTAYSLVSTSIDEAGVYSASLPVAPAREWRRQVARLRSIDDLNKRVKKLEKGLESK